MKLKYLSVVIIMVVLNVAFIAIGANAATYKDMTYKIKNGEVIITDCTRSAAGDLIIPDTIDGYPVTGIEQAAFSGCSSLTSVTIPKTMTSIGRAAFISCSGLKNVIIPDSVVSIESHAFSDCDGLSSIKIPDSVISIGIGAFMRCTNLTDIEMSDNVTRLGSFAFLKTGYYNDSDNWDDDVLYIDNYLLSAKETITGSYTIKPGTKCIAGHAFMDCLDITEVTIPEGISTISDDMFSDCWNLKKVKIPQSVTKIGWGAFLGCCDLEIIEYAGSMDEWQNIYVDYDNEELLRASIICKMPLIKVTVNGEELFFDQPPIIEKGNALVPLRAIFEALGAEVLWDDNSKIVTAVKNNKTVSIEINSDELTIDGEVKTMDSPAKIYNNRTLVSVRTIAESFDCKVEWEDDTKTVIINF